MRDFEDYNPFVITAYFLAVGGIAMFSMNPVVLLLSLAGSITLYITRHGFDGKKSHLIFLGLFLFACILNPLVYHNGVTVLFMLNDNAITLEATIYGVASGMMIVSVLYWFRTYSEMISSDKVLYMVGSIFPKIALIISMALRYVPMFASQTKRVSQTQRAVGLYKDDNIIDTIRGGIRVFSIIVTWSLENGIITADSMEARGYGSGRRSSFKLFRFRKNDLILLLCTATLAAVVITGTACGQMSINYYPEIKISMTELSPLFIVCYGLLCAIPVIIKAGEDIRWKYLMSKS